MPQLDEENLKPVIGSDKILLKNLEALVVLDDASKVDSEGADPDASGIVRNFANRKSLVYSSRFQNIVNQYIGQPVSLRSLNQLSRDIILLYRKCGQPVIDVVIPEQKISQGTVQIVIMSLVLVRLKCRGDVTSMPVKWQSGLNALVVAVRFTNLGLKMICSG